jgi:HlyD family type I secretion membrane fusion protein
VKKLITDPNERIAQLNRSTRRLFIFSAFTVVSIFGAGGYWMTTAQLGSAAVASGVIIAKSERKSIQHLEGGIVDDILVSEGDRVTAGQVILRLDSTSAEASLELLKVRLVSATALENRLRAERDKADEVAFDALILDNQDNPNVVEAMIGEVNIFNARREAIEGQTAILNQKVAQLQEEIKGLNAQQNSEKRQAVLIREEIRDQDILFKKGLAPKVRSLALKRHLAELEGQRGQYLASIARAKQQIAESELSMIDLRNRLMSEVVATLREVQSRIDDTQERLRAAQDVLHRTEIRAPQNGIVADLQFNTPGGVIRPGERIMDLVPDDDELIIEADLRPVDIDVVHVGLDAQIRLTAFNRRSTPPVDGKVIFVSPDRLINATTGLPYYKVLVEVLPKSLAKLKDVELYPGMGADAYIATGSRTAIDYLTSPILDSLDRVAIED